MLEINEHLKSSTCLVHRLDGEVDDSRTGHEEYAGRRAAASSNQKARRRTRSFTIVFSARKLGCLTSCRSAAAGMLGLASRSRMSNGRMPAVSCSGPLDGAFGRYRRQLNMLLRNSAHKERWNPLWGAEDAVDDCALITVLSRPYLGEAVDHFGELEDSSPTGYGAASRVMAACDLNARPSMPASAVGTPASRTKAPKVYCLGNGGSPGKTITRSEPVRLNALARISASPGFTLTAMPADTVTTRGSDEDQALSAVTSRSVGGE